MKENNRLDAAWQFFESKISKGIKKKDIVGLLNEAGFTTLKGKPWTYQTILLEQRKRGGGRKPQKEAPVQSKSKSKSSSAVPDIENFLFGDASVKESRSLQGLERMLKQHSFEDALRYFLDEGWQMSELSDALHKLGMLDRKGHAWNEITLNYHLANALIRSDQNSSREPKGGLMAILGKSKSKSPVQKELSDYDLKREAMWSLIEVELARGAKNKALVGILNLNGFLTRRGKVWTYQTLIQELKRRPESLVKPRESSDEKKRFDGLGAVLDFARGKIESEVLSQLVKSRTPKGKRWSYECLLWELLKRDLDL
jgi:hypothetical protein